MPETAESEGMKLSALMKLQNGVSPTKSHGPSNYIVAGKKVHARFCHTNDRQPHLFKFNINPNSLKADYELWVCGENGLYYLIPTTLMKQVYDDPDTYPDTQHPDIRVVSVDISTDKITYKTGGGKLHIAMYRNGSV